jgi:IS30 family transposase
VLREREEIRAGIERKETFTAIAMRLGRSVSTISREVKANGGRKKYEAWRSHERAQVRSWRPKTTKLSHRPLATEVTAFLEDLWSPEEIVAYLRTEYATDPMMHVSHETIYKALYVQGRGELRRELHRCLRTGRAHRKPRDRLIQGVPHIRNMVMISERPPEIEDRAVPGHWEGDLIIGKNQKSQVGTLVERSTRFVILLHLEDRKAETVRDAMAKEIAKLPRILQRSVTWDQGKEMSFHERFTDDTGIQVYFCDPHSPWQRGSNENTNGLLRQYMPKGTDLSVHSPEDLQRIADSLNGRPRKTLGFVKPSEKLAEFLAMTV